MEWLKFFVLVLAGICVLAMIAFIIFRAFLGIKNIRSHSDSAAYIALATALMFTFGLACAIGAIWSYIGLIEMYIGG